MAPRPELHPAAPRRAPAALAGRRRRGDGRRGEGRRGKDDELRGGGVGRGGSRGEVRPAPELGVPRSEEDAGGHGGPRHRARSIARLLQGGPQRHMAVHREPELLARARRSRHNGAGEQARDHPELHQRVLELHWDHAVQRHVLHQRVRGPHGLHRALHRRPARLARARRLHHRGSGLVDGALREGALQRAAAAPERHRADKRRHGSDLWSPFRPMAAPRVPPRVPVSAPLRHDTAEELGRLGSVPAEHRRYQGGDEVLRVAAAARGCPLAYGALD
mmetsp:Transcript_12102/g.32976  ORF Transcript_12102/g.32976 Transcript_12102/m.32976 type:complete len:276 (+) Transcript_12102:532-1359(+)